MDPIGPLRLAPILKEKVWGGRALSRVAGIRLPPAKRIGEAWLVSDRPGDDSVVADGPLAGATLGALREECGPTLLGRARPERGRFPLLVKLLDAAGRLSVQVHPDDARAGRERESDPGKTEAWWVLAAGPRAEVLLGPRPGTDREGLGRALREGSIERNLERFRLRSGARVYLPAGTIHSVGRGAVFLEIQQNSDLTYRLHDWARGPGDGPPRPLQPEKALRSVRFGRRRSRPLPVAFRRCAGGCRVARLAAGPYFRAVAWRARRRAGRTGGTPVVLVFLRGRGTVRSRSAEPESPFVPGNAFVLPAALGAFAVEASGGEALWVEARPARRRS